MASFTLTIKDFQGPIEALLSLIEKRKLPINDISLAEIASEYIEFINSLDHESLSHTTHFIFVAATLTLIKSKSLLPSLDLSHEEEHDIESLKRQLEILKHYQEAGQLLKEHYHPKPQFFFKRPSKKSISFQPHESLTLDSLSTNILDLFREFPVLQPLQKEASIKIAVHIEEMMKSLEQRLLSISQTNFKDYIHACSGDHCEPKELKVYRVVGFLAMLELVRKGILDVLQKHNFENIHLEKI